jgi:putative transposase
MPRSPRITPAGYVYHVLNRGVERRKVFSQDTDYQAFRDILSDGTSRFCVRLIAYAVMPTHWHLVLWPKVDEAISAFMHWVTSVHSRHVRRSTETVGFGHLYQERFRSFPVQENRYYWKLLHYVEANPLRAGLVDRAEHSPWTSLGDVLCGLEPIVVEGPLPRPMDWVQLVNEPIPKEELEALRDSTRRGRPYGNREWTIEAANHLGLQRSLRDIGGQWTLDGVLGRRRT